MLLLENGLFYRIPFRQVLIELNVAIAKGFLIKR